MTNEEFLRLFNDLVNNFDDYSLNESRRRINELRDYARDYLNNNNLANDLQRVSDVTYGSVQANPNEPKDIVLSTRQNVDDRIINGTNEEEYYRNLDRKVVSEYLDKKNGKEESEIDRSIYIPGTDILKPRDRNINETDEEYVKYLEEYYAKHFPNSNEKSLSLVNDEPKGLAVLKDVKKTESIEKIEETINSDSNVADKIDEDFQSDFAGIDGLDIDEDDKSREIFSNSDGTSASIMSDIEKEKKQKEQGTTTDEETIESDDKSEEIVFDSDEEKEAFEKDQEIDYSKDKDSKTKKIGKIRKAAIKFKEVFKKHGKKIIAGILVAATAIGAALTAKSCSYDKKEDLNENKDNPKSNTDEYDSSIPSIEASDDFGVDTSDIFDKFKNNVENNDESKDMKSDITIDDNASFSDSNKAYQIETINVDDFDIGDTVNFDGNSLYETSYNAANNVDPLTLYYSNSDDREVSAIRLLSPDGKQAMTVTTKGEAKELEDKGWIVESVNMRNNDHNTQYEGWANLDDVSKVK